MTQDLRESYDINFAKINVKRNGVNIHEFQVSPMSRKYLLFRGTYFRFVSIRNKIRKKTKDHVCIQTIDIALS